MFEEDFGKMKLNEQVRRESHRTPGSGQNMDTFVFIGYEKWTVALALNNGTGHNDYNY